ncbi:histidine kinase N-terminal 7TM domain-containing protein [Neptunicoccus sediminis]|uniref:sensor histidine kinase n=1 Tax=Neptunicoccus sediminis TaxID=1892596 RepID=UPI000845F31B|nr:histidine kinase N-terminal 7TM domain-containing protein [Neptunicoccus sediminis]
MTTLLSQCLRIDLGIPAVQFILATSLVVAALAFWIRGHRSLPGSKWFILGIVFMLWWLATVGFEISSAGKSCKLFWAKAAWPGIVLLPTFWSFFLFEYTLSRPVPRRIVVLCSFVMPAFVFALAATNPLHGLFYSAGTTLRTDAIFPYVYYEHGPYFYFSIAYLYVLTMGCTLIAGRAALRADPSVRSFFVKLFLTTIIPIVSNVLHVGFDFKIFDVDPTPFSFAVSVILIFWLITDRRWIDMNAIARDLFFYNSRDLVFVLDRDGTLHNTNQSARDFITRYDQTLKTPPQDLPAFGPVFRQLIDRTTLPENVDIPHDGKHFVARAYPIALGQGQPLLGWAVAFVDITTQKQTADRAIAAERSQAQFLATVSHELRTPLTAINGSLSLLTNSKAKISDTQADSLMRLMTKNAASLAALVNDLLDTQALASSDFNLNREAGDLQEILGDAIASMATFLPEKNVTLAYSPLDPPVPVFADSVRIRQVIVNVLSNAMKFSDSGTEVGISLKTTADTATIFIKDNGRGIPPNSEDKVFGRFSQIAEGDERKITGSGLGMHISRQIMLQHGGTITYESTLGAGTTFAISIPLDQAA